MKHKKLKDFKEDLLKLTEPQLRDLLNDTRQNIGDMESQLAERNAYDEVEEEPLEEDIEWRARCLTALKWERRRYALIKRAISRKENIDPSVQHLKHAVQLLRKFVFENETPSQSDRRALFNIIDYLKNLDVPRKIDEAAKAVDELIASHETSSEIVPTDEDQELVTKIPMPKQSLKPPREPW